MDVEKTIALLLDLETRSQKKQAAFAAAHQKKQAEFEAAHQKKQAEFETKFNRRHAAAERRADRADARMDRADIRSDKFDKKLEAMRKLMEVGMRQMFDLRRAQRKNERGLDRLERLVAASIQGRTNGKG